MDHENDESRRSAEEAFQNSRWAPPEEGLQIIEHNDKRHSQTLPEHSPLSVFGSLGADNSGADQSDQQRETKRVAAGEVELVASKEEARYYP